MTIKNQEYAEDEIEKEARTYGELLMSGVEISSSKYSNRVKKPRESDKIIDDLEEQLDLPREEITDSFKYYLMETVARYGRECAKEYIKNNPEEFRVEKDTLDWLNNEFEENMDMHKFRKKKFESESHKKIKELVVYELIKDWYNMGFKEKVKMYISSRKYMK